MKTEQEVIDQVFGEGMSAAWTEGTSEARFDKTSIEPRKWVKKRRGRPGRVFFIPAHRALLLTEGWPAPFLRLNADTPVVARLFSQHLCQRLGGRQTQPMFPVPRSLKSLYRGLIDDAFFHGGRVDLDKDGLKHRLRLKYDDGVELSYMAWTAGQREFAPLLMGLCHVLTPRRITKQDDIKWVVVEEPEMGLHPKAIEVFMLLVLELLWRGYKVVLSTHSIQVLDVVWTIRHLHEHRASWTHLRDAFGLRNAGQVRKVLEHAIQVQCRVYFLDMNSNRRVTTRDISNLDPGASDEHEADWGGLTGFSSRSGDAVRRAVNEADQK